MATNNQLTNTQVDAIESRLRDAQRLVEDAGAIVSVAGGEENSAAWYRLTSLANDIGDVICRLWRLRPEEEAYDED